MKRMQLRKIQNIAICKIYGCKVICARFASCCSNIVHPKKEEATV